MADGTWQHILGPVIAMFGLVIAILGGWMTVHYRAVKAEVKADLGRLTDSKHHSNTAARHRLHFAGGNVQRS